MINRLLYAGLALVALTTAASAQDILDDLFEDVEQLLGALI